VWDNPPVWPTWRALLPHVLAATDPTRALGEVVAEVSWLLRRAGGYIQSRGEPWAARPLLERAYQLDRDRLDADDPDMLATSMDLALVLSELGEHEQARPLAEDTLTRYRRVLGEDHPNTLNSAYNLALVLGKLGEHEKARALAEDTLIRYRRVLGEDDLNTLDSAHDLAVCLSELGEHEKARTLAEDTLIRYRRVGVQRVLDRDPAAASVCAAHGLVGLPG
jgi:tetratricopeptide (TPR) repeat protein